MQWEELKDKVKNEYITTSISYRKLAEKYGLSRVTMGVTPVTGDAVRAEVVCPALQWV